MLLYLHIPFCHRICPYCSFYKHTPGNTPISSLVDAITLEAQQRLPQNPRTLYLGGGTPSMLSPSHLRRLFEPLHDLFPFSALDEVTMEANPATFDAAKAQLFRQLGVTRISLGIQSFTPHVLTTLGREHSPQQAADAVHLLRDAGIPSVNIDLMFSIPNLSLDDWQHTLETAISLNPDHISAYNLTYEEDTAFFESLRNGELDADEDRDAAQFHLAHDLLTAAGFEHYETSNYSRPGHHSTHNQGYWHGEDYLGLGPSAVSTLGPRRDRNIPDTSTYVRMIREIGNAIIDSESLTPDQQRLERVALLLRTSQGVPLSLINPSTTAHLVADGFAEIQRQHLILTRKGAALVDPIAAELA